MSDLSSLKLRTSKTLKTTTQTFERLEKLSKSLDGEKLFAALKSKFCLLNLGIFNFDSCLEWVIANDGISSVAESYKMILMEFGSILTSIDTTIAKVVPEVDLAESEGISKFQGWLNPKRMKLGRLAKELEVVSEPLLGLHKNLQVVLNLSNWGRSD